MPKGSFSVDGEAKTIDKLFAGEKAILSFTDLSSNDFPKDKDFYLYAGDEITTAKVVEGEDKKLSLSIDFTVPETKTDLILVPAAGTIDDKGVGINIDTLPEGIKVYGVKDGDKYTSGQGAYLFVKKEAGYKLSFQYKSGTGDFQNGTLDSSGFAFIPLSGETEVKFATENVGFHKITYVGAEDIGSIDGKTDFVLPKTYTVGERFSPTNIVAKDGKYIESIVATGADGKELYKNSNSPSAIYFEMPDQDVTITFTIKDNGKITFTGWEDYLQEAPKVIDGRSLSDGKEVTSAPKDKYLTVYIKPKSNYKVGALQYGKGKTASFFEDWSNPGYFSASFSMPEGDVTLSLTNIASLYTVTVENSDTEGASITLNSTSGFAKGETVNFNVIVPDKTYALKSLLATYGGKTETWTVGKEITLNSIGSSGSFTMVDSDISIKPVFEKVQTIDVDVTADAGVTFSLRTSVSQTTIGEAGTQKLLPNDEISVNNVATPSTDSAKFVQIQVTDSNDKVTNYDPVYLSTGNSINYNYSANFDVTGDDGATVKAIKFALVDRAAIKATIKNDSKVGFKLKINDKDAADLTSLKQYDKLTFSFDESTFEKGYAYSYTLKDDQGNSVTANAGADSYLLLSANPLTLEVSKKKTYSATVNIAPAESAIGYQSWGMTIDGSQVYSKPTTFVEGAKVNITSITISNKNYQPYSWTLEVKIGDKTYTTDSNKIGSTPLTFTVDADVVFNFTLS